MDNVIMICGISSCMLILSCIIASMMWIYEAYTLSNDNMCVVDKRDDPNNYAFYLCPLNQSLVDSILGIKQRPYYNNKYLTNIQDHYNKGTLKISELFNTRYSGGTPPPTSGDTVYCNLDYTICEQTKSPGIYNSISYAGPLTLTPYAIYTIPNPDKTIGFYMDNNMIIQMTSNSYINIQDFLNDIDRYQSQHDDCLNYYTLQKTTDSSGKILDLQTINENKTEASLLSTKCVFFKNPVTIIATLSNALFLGLTPQLLTDYLQILQNKRNTNTMTTFDYFAYFAVISSLNNTSELVLTSKNTTTLAPTSNVVILDN